MRRQESPDLHADRGQSASGAVNHSILFNKTAEDTPVDFSIEIMVRGDSTFYKVRTSYDFTPDETPPFPFCLARCRHSWTRCLLGQRYGRRRW